MLDYSFETTTKLLVTSAKANQVSDLTIGVSLLFETTTKLLVTSAKANQVSDLTIGVSLLFDV